MPLGRMIAAVFVFCLGTNVALYRAVDERPTNSGQVIVTNLSTSTSPVFPRVSNRASRGHSRKPMTGLRRIKEKTCWNGFVGTIYDRCPPKPVVRPIRQSPRFAVSGSAEAWAHSAKAVRVANCESGGGPNDHSSTYDGDPHLRDGMYHGKWQMDSSFWSSYGGLRFASDAADATEAEQDAVAYRGYLARGWEPWTCASMV